MARYSVLTSCAAVLVVVASCTTEAPDYETVDELFDLAQSYYRDGDYAEAVMWYRRAADQGHAEAMFVLGSMYSYSEGMGDVPRDKVEAAKWYRSAAELGDHRSANNLGWMYSRGEGVPQDDVQAAEWLSRSNELEKKSILELADHRCVKNGELLLGRDCLVKLADTCDARISWTKRKEGVTFSSGHTTTDVAIYKVIPKGRKPVDARCLFPEAARFRKPDKPSPAQFVCWEDCENRSEGLWERDVGLIGLDDGLLILSAPFSDGGVVSVQQVSGDHYILASQFSTHRRNYGFDVDGDYIRSYPDGDVKYLDYDAGIYQTDMEKNFWNTTGAFWMSVVYDANDEILDMPPRDESDESIVCVPKRVFIECTSYSEEDLRNVDRDKICTWGGTYPDTPCSEWAP
ncbi:MAG: sel1 repeat family protein [Proteobacteria bacterium]|nr:sel1 repeat family protein [Pseudomonadota bacterium]